MASHHDLALDIHHIFPKAWCRSHEVSDLRRESIVNKTAISASTNRTIGGKAPSAYLVQLRDRAETTEEELRRRVEQHEIDFDLLRADEFDAFFEARQTALLVLIADAMGKSVSAPAPAACRGIRDRGRGARRRGRRRGHGT